MDPSPLSPLSPWPSPSGIVPEEDFNLFHAIDRDLFTRLVFRLGRDPAESTQVMAFWLWLEHNGTAPSMVQKNLSFPDTMLDAIADEAVMALTCIDSDVFPYNPPEGSSSPSAVLDIPLTQNLSRRSVSLHYFHDNRLGVLRGVTKVCNEVCIRAFKDIVQLYHEKKEAGGYFSRAAAVIGGQQNDFILPPNYVGRVPANPYAALPIQPSVQVPVVYPNNPGMGFVNMSAGLIGAAPQAQPQAQSQPQAAQRAQVLRGGGSSSNTASAEYMRLLDPYDLVSQRSQILNSEISELLSRLQLNPQEEPVQRELVPPDERTIFLTFSKGYPISEEEVLQFFGRRYREYIEAIHMQEVAQDEQPLYARLVVKSASAIDTILEGRSRAKYSINGKHVWARKYVRKNPLAPSSSLSSDPAAE